MRRHQIENAAFGIATQVRAVEDIIDSALAEIAELQSRMVHARAAMGVGPATGQDAFLKLGQTVSSLIGARGEMAAATLRWPTRPSLCPACARCRSATAAIARRPRPPTCASSPDQELTGPPQGGPVALS